MNRAMMQTLALLLLIWSYPLAAEPSSVTLYASSEDFESTKENLTMAIMGEGLSVTNTLHISEMLNRTGADLGFPREVYLKAESLEFCSAQISHLMTQLDPLNLAICPFTLSIFIKTEQPEQVFVAHRMHQLAGAEGDEKRRVTSAVNNLLSDIVKEALN
ncbi:MAG: hypothetical protein HQL48_05975 [Gammaproteobacteria bacterium]|nr:hypothetical protein [Gammaproteobacteria bacterium]